MVGCEVSLTSKNTQGYYIYNTLLLELLEIMNMYHLKNSPLSFNTSIHPSIIVPLSGAGSKGNSRSRDTQTSISPDTSSNFSGGISRRSQATSRSSMSQVFLWVASQWDTTQAPPARGVRGAPQLTPLDVEEQELYSGLLLGDRSPHQGAPRHPVEKAHFGSFHLGSCFFGHGPKFHDHR